MRYIPSEKTRLIPTGVGTSPWRPKTLRVPKLPARVPFLNLMQKKALWSGVGSSTEH